jgi:hypothetical protein
MKPRNSFVYLLLILFLSAPFAFSDVIIDSINYKIDLGDFGGSPNSIAKMPVKLKNATVIGGFMFRIEYNTTLLELIDIGPVGSGTALYDSLELSGSGWNTIVIDSADGTPPWDTLYSVFAFHDPGDDSINAEALFIMFTNPMFENPNIPINNDAPATILNLLFRVKPGAIPGQTAEILVKNYVGPYPEYRNVQLSDTAGFDVIYPGEGPLFATCLFTVDPVYCGDVNGDSVVNIFDITSLIAYLYQDGPAPDPLEKADVNNDGAVNIFDITHLIAYLYQDGPPLDCPPAPIDSVILPLTIGNQWITDVVEYNEYGQIVDEYTGTGTVIGDTAIESRTWYFMETDSGGTDTSLWTNKENGAWAWTDSSGSPEVLMLKYPASPGESYPVYDVTVTVESTNTEETVPAGSFTCYYYRAHIPIFGTVGRIWAAPNIGVVRAEEYGLTLFGTYLAKEIELISYDLAKR